MKRLEGKIAVITGGNSGIGLAAAKEFISEGAKVMVAGRDEVTLGKAAKELGKNALAIQVDVSNLSDLDRLYSEVKTRFGKIDILFANAGVGQFTPIEQITEKYFDDMFAINVKGLFFTVQKAIPLLKPGSSVILTSSSIIEKGVPGGSVYAATKAAVRSLARTFSVELLDRKIRVNVLSPGPVDTPIFGRSAPNPIALKTMIDAMKARIPLKRFGRSEEIAKVALFLASDDSSFILGSDIAADGGISQI